MTKKISLLFALLLPLFMLAGCGSPIEFVVSNQYDSLRPRTIAVLPVKWHAGADHDRDNISNLLRTMTRDRLISMNYRVIPLDLVDREAGGEAAREGPTAIARLLGADAVLYIGVEKWDKMKISDFASLDIKTRFELYSARGTRLWAADYRDKDMDFRFDPKPMDFAVIKAYEPKLQRLVDSAFDTLPNGAVVTKAAKKTYFQWLP